MHVCLREFNSYTVTIKLPVRDTAHNFAGANDGQDISNTKVLDDRGWKGICVDPFPKNFDSRTCHWVRHAVHSLKHEVSFTRADIFGGIKEHFSSSHAGTVNGAPEELLEAKVLAEILEEADAPTYIDYFSLDTEGSEEEILRSFPFNKYAFGAITVEHNHEEPKCANIRSILEKSGYSLAKEVNFDDWYVNNIFMPVRGSKAWVKFNQTLGSIGV